MHCWTGSHWSAIDGEQGVEMAMNWLQAHHPDQVNKSTAKSCFESATICAKPLCEQNRKRCIIPLRNVYLEVTAKGKILMHKPNPSFGITYVLDIGLPLSGTSYTPAAVPAQSLFGQFLKTSIPDQGVQNYLQEGMGYTLTPYTIHQVALVLKGAGCNGKSVMVRILSALHGRVAAMDLKNLKNFGLTKLVVRSINTVTKSATITMLPPQLMKVVNMARKSERPALVLTHEQRSTLQELSASRVASAREVERAKVMLGYADGVSIPTFSADLGSVGP